jgi:uncharacterized Zn finger protein (UPF0148 family)
VNGDDDGEVKKKHLGTVNCPACGVVIEIIEEETIDQPYQKKISHKELVAAKTVTKPLA